MHRKILFALMLCAPVCGMIYASYVTVFQPSITQELPVGAACKTQAIDVSDRVPVSLNRGPEVLDGFRGEIHPFLHQSSEMTLTATWKFDPDQRSGSAFLSRAPAEIQRMFLSLGVSVPTRRYTERVFSRFLPAGERANVGEMWALDLDTVAEMLKQFDPSPSMRLVARGRRAGPDGAFAILRAVSLTHLDILFRVHAEFNVMAEGFKLGPSVPEAWYSPGCFLGRLVVNRGTGKVEYFRLGLPTDTAYNVHITAASGEPGEELHGWMCVEDMALVGGSLGGIENIHWTNQIEPGLAYDRLTTIFYTFKKINWVSFEKAQDLARAEKKPLFIVVALGALDNQTC